MNIVKITVLTRKHGTDLVTLTTDLPSPIPNVTKQPATLQFNCQAETGVAYVRKHLGIEPEVINT